MIQARSIARTFHDWPPGRPPGPDLDAVITPAERAALLEGFSLWGDVVILSVISSPRDCRVLSVDPADGCLGVVATGSIHTLRTLLLRRWFRRVEECGRIHDGQIRAMEIYRRAGRSADVARVAGVPDMTAEGNRRRLRRGE